MNMTMKELARLANVSVSTVSKAFCEAEDVSEETRNHIFKIAKEHGCFGKYYKGRFHKKIIAIVCPEIGSSYYARFIEILQTLIERSGGITLISADGFSTSKQSELIEYYASYLKVDGLIVFGLRSKLKRGCRVPIVSLFSSIDADVDSVNIDMNSAIRDAVHTLSELGHHSIAFLSEPLCAGKAACFRAVAPHGLVVESSKRFEDAGEDGVAQLLRQGAEFSALICAYDNIALGAMRALGQIGKRVPEDVSVIGIDNIPISGHSQTTLTSIDTDPDEVCEIAWELLQKKIKSPYFKARQSVVLKPHLILRESVCARNE